jgi:hypothetical protein
MLAPAPQSSRIRKVISQSSRYISNGCSDWVLILSPCSSCRRTLCSKPPCTRTRSESLIYLYPISLLKRLFQRDILSYRPKFFPISNNYPCLHGFDDERPHLGGPLARYSCITKEHPYWGGSLQDTFYRSISVCFRLYYPRIPLTYSGNSKIPCALQACIV